MNRLKDEKVESGLGSRFCGSVWDLTRRAAVTLVVAAAAANSAALAAIIGFEDLPGMTNRASVRQLRDVSGSGQSYAGIEWDGVWWVAGNEYVAGHDSEADDSFSEAGKAHFARPHSGNFALFNGMGTDGLIIVTPQILTGAWFARPRLAHDPGGATQVTLTALSNTTALASVTLALTNSEPVFMDTRSFLRFSSITRYAIHRREGPGLGSDKGYFILDDIQFAEGPSAGKKSK